MRLMSPLTATVSLELLLTGASGSKKKKKSDWPTLDVIYRTFIQSSFTFFSLFVLKCLVFPNVFYGLFCTWTCFLGKCSLWRVRMR